MLAKRIPEGGMWPRGYGYAYREWDRNEAVCYPLGLNWLVGWVRMAWIALAHGPRNEPSATDMQLLQANLVGQSTGIAIGEERGRIKGFTEGREFGRQLGWNAAFAQLEKDIAAGSHR